MIRLLTHFVTAEDFYRGLGISSRHKLSVLLAGNSSFVHTLNEKPKISPDL